MDRALAPGLSWRYCSCLDDVGVAVVLQVLSGGRDGTGHLLSPSWTCTGSRSRLSASIDPPELGGDDASLKRVLV